MHPFTPAPAIKPALLPAEKSSPPTVWITKSRIVFSRVVAVGLLCLVCLTHSQWAPQHQFLGDLEMLVGLLLVTLATVGRMWCSLYIAGYKDKRILNCGPYSMCRHPLYFFSFLGAIGIACASLTLTLPLFVGIGFVLGYQSIMKAEENFLTKKFGIAYTDYCASVPRLFPDPAKLVHVGKWESNPLTFFRHLGSVIWFVPILGIVTILRHLAQAAELPGWLLLP